MKSPYEIKRKIVALGTFIEITWQGNDTMQHEITLAFDEIKKLETIFSYHNNESELTKFNIFQKTKSIELKTLLKIVKCLKNQTNNIFNPINPQNNIDLGGIAKGFIVDKIAKKLKSFGINGIINAGGDIRIFGTYNAPIYIRDPFNFENNIYIGNFQNTSIASSCISENSQIRGGKSIVYKPSDVIHASIFGKSCTICDAMTKVALTNPEIALEILKKIGYHGFIIDKHGNKFTS